MRAFAQLVRSCAVVAAFILPCVDLSAAGDPPSPELPVAVESDIVATPPATERIIYVPFQNLDGVLERPDANVVLPYAEYQRLLKSWNASQAAAQPPGAVISSADYRVVVTGSQAKISATLQVTSPAASWSEIPLRFGEAAVGEFTAPEGVLLKGIGDGLYALLLPRAGEYTLTLELAARVRESPEGSLLSWECPPVPVTSVSVEVPQADQKVEIAPAAVVETEAETGPDVTRVSAHVGAARKISVTWRPEVSRQPEMNLLAGVTNNTLINFSDGLVRADAWLTFDVLRGELAGVRLALPRSHRILDVAAAGQLRAWSTQEQGENQIVTIELLNPVTTRLDVEIHTEFDPPEGPVDVAGMTDAGAALGIHAMDVVRETGQVAIRGDGDLALTVAEVQRAARIEAGELSPKLAGRNAFNFKFYTPRFALRIAAAPIAARVSVANRVIQEFQNEELRVENHLTYTIDRAGIFELRFQLPEGLVVDRVEGAPVREFRVEEATRQLVVALAERTQGALSLSLFSHQPLDPNVADLNLPLIEPLGVEREIGVAHIFARPALEIRVNQPDVTAAQPRGTEAGSRRGEAVETSVWTFTRRPVVIPVRIERKPTRLSARLGTLIDVQPEVTHVTTRVNFLVEHAGVDTFRIAVPEAVSNLVRIEVAPGATGSVPIRQRTPGTPANGQVVWTILTQREALGLQSFEVTYDINDADVPPAANDAAVADAAAPPAGRPIELIRPLGLVNESGEVVTPLTQLLGEVTFTRHKTIALTVETAAEELEQIDVRELTLLPRDGLLAYRYFRDQAETLLSLTLRPSTFDIQQVITTVVPRGLVEIVVGEDDAATYRVRLQVKSTERQRLLMFLPVNLDVLGAFLNDRELKLEKADAAIPPELGENFSPYWVNVARGESSDAPFLLTLNFLWDVKPSLRESSGLRGELELPLPVLGAAADGVVQELKVVVWPPEDYLLVGSPAGFELQGDRLPAEFLVGTPPSRDVGSLQSWVAAGAPVANVPQLPTGGRDPYIYSSLGGRDRVSVTWWNRVTMTLLFSVALLLIGWILAGTSWENKLSFLLLLAFVAMLYGLYDRAALSQAVYAMRFGLLAMLGLWVIHGVARALRPKAVPTPPPAPPPPAAQPA